jgi:hypothetical protein
MASALTCPRCATRNEPYRWQCWACDATIRVAEGPPVRRHGWISSNPILAAVQLIAIGVAVLAVIGVLGIALLFITCVASLK